MDFSHRIYLIESIKFLSLVLRTLLPPAAKISNYMYLKPSSTNYEVTKAHIYLVAYKSTGHCNVLYNGVWE